MSTYWYIDLDAPLRVDEAEASASFAQAMSTIGHRLDSYRHHFPALVADGLPFRPAGSEVGEPADLPEDGWTTAAGRLRARLFAENLTSPTDEDEGSCRHAAMLDCLAAILDASSGTIVGALAHENSECKGPLVKVGDVVRWLPSVASHPGRGYDFGPDLETIDRVPPDLLHDALDGLTCDVDVDELVARIKGTG
jgi:hypothetical protein